MATNLIDSVKGMLTSDTVEQAATETGESPEGMRKAMHGAVPAAFAGLAHAASGPGGATRIFALLTQTGGSPRELLSSVFGDRSEAVSGAVAQGSGVKSGSATHAMSLAMPLVLAALGKHVLANRMTPGALSRMLHGHEQAIADDPSTPPGLAGALGLGSLAGLGHAPSKVAEAQAVAEPAAGAQPAAVAEPAGNRARRSRSAKLLPALLLGLLAIWGIMWLGRHRMHAAGVTAPQPTTQETGEARMTRAIDDPAAPLPQTFALQNLTFDPGRAAPSPDAAQAVDYLAAMMLAHPSVRIHVIGHTDASEPGGTNPALSEARAKAVQQALVAKGIAADRIETSGEAPGEAAPGTTPDGAANRRAEIVLLSR